MDVPISEPGMKMPVRRLWRAIPGLVLFVCAALFYANKSLEDKEAANNQQVIAGLVLNCKNSARGTNYCSYMFSVDETHYTSRGIADSSFVSGQTVPVYYDPQNPHISSLEDYSSKARSDETRAYIFLAVAAAFLALVISQRKPVIKSESSSS